jgi:hypothetical protein
MVLSLCREASDALLDLTNRGDLVIDPFLGSGSTLIAAEATGRVCRGVELDSLYVDVIIRRYQAASGDPAVLVETGETFQALGLSQDILPGRGLLRHSSSPSPHFASVSLSPKPKNSLLFWPPAARQRARSWTDP